MKTLLLFLALTATSAAALPSEELHRLGAYLAYSVAAVSAEVAPSPKPTPGNGVCSECNGLKKIGDGTIMFTCPRCNGTGREPGASQVPEDSPQIPQPEEESSPPLTSMKQTKWNWNGAGSPPLSVKRKHLISEHSVEPNSVNKMSNAEIESLHNLLHNSEVRAAAPKAKSSCPGGNCPTSSSSSSRSRYRLFRR